VSAPRRVDAAPHWEVRRADAPFPGLKKVGPALGEELVPVAAPEADVEEAELLVM